jgi:hypothetical protein
MLDNIGGGMGRLPNEAMRQRMRALVDSFPPTPVPKPVSIQYTPEQPQGGAIAPVAVSAAVLDRYVGQYRYAVANQTVTFRRDGDRLMMKFSGNIPELVVVPRSETRFQDPGGLIFEFQVDAQGKVTGAVVEMGPDRIHLERQ